MPRQKKKAGERKTNCLRVMLAEADRKAIDAAAYPEDTSSWVRRMILEIIREKKKQ